MYLQLYLSVFMKNVVMLHLPAFRGQWIPDLKLVMVGATAFRVTSIWTIFNKPGKTNMTMENCQSEDVSPTDFPLPC